MASSLTLILSTYNRAEDLVRTLEAFCALDRDGIDVEFVVVDNNSNDATSTVIEAFRDRIPLRGIFHSVPGKNRALNRALDEVRLREIVVFTDDDVTPRQDWFKKIIVASNEHPECAVFGGKIDVVWPHGSPPRWAEAKWVQAFAFARHDYASGVVEYSRGTYPFGPNLWVRSSIFADGLRYKEHIGPQPKNRLIGSETSFLFDLEGLGHKILFIPDAVVGHRIQAKDLNKQTVARRAARHGRSTPHVFGLPEEHLLKKSPVLWAAKRLTLILRGFLVGLRGTLTLDESTRFSRICSSRGVMALNAESLRLAIGRPRGGPR